MKKTIITAITALIITLTATAQTLNVVTGNVTYQFPAAQTGDMTYTEGTTITVMGKVFNISDITSLYVDWTSVTDNQVTVTYNGTTAAVSVAGNVARYVLPTVNGAHVSVAQSNTADVDGDEITYQLSGTSADGEFALSGAYKCTVSLNGLTLTNPSGAAINSTNKKRLQVSAKKGTVNTLTDGANGAQKGCLYSKGQIQLQGNGTLNVSGQTAHAIKSGDYISVKNLTLNITSAVKDGISSNKYFLMKSGIVSISGVGDDGIQCDLESDKDATGATTDHEDENSGNVYIESGTLTVGTTAAASKGVKAEGDVVVSGGTVSVTTSGDGTWDEDELDTKAACGLSASKNMTISGGTLTLQSSGQGGKCLKCDSVLTISGTAVINATATGTEYTYTYDGTSYSSSPKAIKAGYRVEKASSESRTVSSEVTAGWPGGDGPGGGGPGGDGPGGGGPGGGPGGDGPGGGPDPGGDPGQFDYKEYDYYGGIVISGGTVNAKSTNHEAIESKSTIDISGGYVYAEAGDDAINSASDFTISGGYVMGNSSYNDGLDANGNFYIKGGVVVAVGTGIPEVGIDANTEIGKKLYITGGNVVAIGGLENESSLTGVTQKSIFYNKDTWYTFKSGTTTVFSFKVPSNSQMGYGMTLVSSSSPSVSSGAITGTTIWNGYGVVNE